MKGVLVLVELAMASLVLAYDDQCPPEQATDWQIEKLLRHDDCNKFYQCTFGKPVEKVCPSNLYFNLDTWQCDWPDNVDCSGRNDPSSSSPEPTTTTTTTTTTPPPTPSTASTTTTTITTPTSSTTTPAPTRTTPTTTATPDNQCPPEQGTNWDIEKLLPHEDCNKFYQCTYGKPVEKICPSNLYFNLNTWQCDWPENVDCSGRNDPTSNTSTPVPTTTSTSPTPSPTTPTPTPTPTPTTSSSAKPTATPDDQCPPEQETNWEIEKLLRHEDCNKFYQCTHGKPVEKVCPANLYFNLDTWLCDWPENVNCSDRNVPDLTTTPTTVTTPSPTPTPTIPTAPTPTPTIPTAPTPTPTKPTSPTPTTSKPTNCTCPTTTTTRRPTTTTTTTTPVPDPEFLPNGCPVNPHIHWLLPHETDCNLFYYCVWGEKVLRMCPSSLHFNRKIQVCDWPSVAGCTKSRCKKVKNSQ